MFNNTEPTNLNPKPYGWYPYSTKSGMHVGFMKKDELIDLSLLKDGLPLKEAWEIYKEFPGIKKQLNGIKSPGEGFI